MEVEIKLRVENYEEIRNKLIEKFNGKYLALYKYDCYYEKDNQILRVRQDDDQYYLTHKGRTHINGVEVNDEIEAEILEPKEMVEIIKTLGFKLLYEKEKIGNSFFLTRPEDFKEIVFDLSRVNDIGAFLEIEMIVEPDEVDDTVKYIKKLAYSLGFTDDDIETKSYKELILGK